MEAKLAKIQEIFRDVLDDESIEITRDYSPADNAGWDSVAMMQIILSVESEFGVRFTTEEMAGVKSVDDILKKIH